MTKKSKLNIWVVDYKIFKSKKKKWKKAQMEDVKNSFTPLERPLMNRCLVIFLVSVLLSVSWVMGIRNNFENLEVSDRLEVSKPLTNF